MLDSRRQPCTQDSLRSEALSTLWKCAAIAKQIIVHINTEAVKGGKMLIECLKPMDESSVQ